MAVGRREGREEGQQAKQYEIVRNMLSQGYDPDEIVGITGGSITQIKEIQAGKL